MSRRVKPAAAPAAPPVNEDVVADDLQAATELGRRLAVVDEQFGDGQLYDRARLVNECRFYIQQTGQALLELGRRLVLLKEHEEHGSFQESLRAIGIEPRFARRAMQASIKFDPKRAAPPVLALGQTKLIELLVLDDDEIETLSTGGTVADLSLDDIDRMSTRELRDALRKERDERAEDQTVHEQLLTSKNEKIDELAERLARREGADVDTSYAEIQKELWGVAEAFLDSIGGLRTVFAAIEAARERHGPVPTYLYQSQCDVLVWLMQQVEGVRAESQIVDVDLNSVVQPPWEQEAAAHAERVSAVRQDAARKSVESRRAKKGDAIA